MLKKLAAIAVACSVATPAHADPVHYPFAIEEGAVWQFVQKRSITTSEPNGVSGESTLTASLRVVSVARTGYVMEWTTTSVTTTGNTIGAYGAVAEMMVGTPITFVTDESGAPTRVHEKAKLIEKALVASAVTTSAMRDPNFFAHIRTMFNEMDDETLAIRILSEASIVSQCRNLEVDPDKPTKEQFEEDVGMGPPVLSNYTITMEATGAPKHPARIVIAQSFDAESVKASVRDSMLRLGNSEQEAGKPFTLRNNATTTCHVDTTTGDVVKITSDLDNELDGIAKRDIRTITLTRQ